MAGTATSSRASGQAPLLGIGQVLARLQPEFPELTPSKLPVSDIAGEFTVTRSAISQHLLVLAEAGLVEAEKIGRQRMYRVRPSGLHKLQAEIDRFWTNELDLLVADAQQLRSEK